MPPPLMYLRSHIFINSQRIHSLPIIQNTVLEIGVNAEKVLDFRIEKRSLESQRLTLTQVLLIFTL